MSGSNLGNTLTACAGGAGGGGGRGVELSVPQDVQHRARTALPTHGSPSSAPSHPEQLWLDSDPRTRPDPNPWNPSVSPCVEMRYLQMLSLRISRGEFILASGSRSDMRSQASL